MTIKYPHTIENGAGEVLTFLALHEDAGSSKLFVENYVEPGFGPTMHTHWLQDEIITVVNGKIGYQLLNKPAEYAEAGATIIFKRGVPHRFWNAGTDILHCKGFITPPHSIVFFLSALFAAQKKSGSTKPELFDGAFLLTKYASEYDLPELPGFVKKVLMPLIYQLGKLLGKYKHFENAPIPLKNSNRRQYAATAV